MYRDALLAAREAAIGCVDSSARPVREEGDAGT